MNLIGETAQHLNVNIPQTNKLSYVTPPFSFPEKVEYQHCQYTGMDYVRELLDDLL